MGAAGAAGLGQGARAGGGLPRNGQRSRECKQRWEESEAALTQGQVQPLCEG